MGRTPGAVDKDKRTRRKATQAELQQKQTQREREEQRKRTAAHDAANNARAAFVGRMGGGASRSRSAAAGSSSADSASAGAGNNETDGTADDGAARAAGDTDASGDTGVGFDDDSAAARQPRRDARPAPVEAELDDDAQLGDDPAADGSVMGNYLKAVFDRLHSETIGEAVSNALEAKWLLGMLKEEGADWWLRAARARTVCAIVPKDLGDGARIGWRSGLSVHASDACYMITAELRPSYAPAEHREAIVSMHVVPADSIRAVAPRRAMLDSSSSFTLILH